MCCCCCFLFIFIIQLGFTWSTRFVTGGVVVFSWGVWPSAVKGASIDCAAGVEHFVVAAIELSKKKKNSKKEIKKVAWGAASNPECPPCRRRFCAVVGDVRVTVTCGTCVARVVCRVHGCVREAKLEAGVSHKTFFYSQSTKVSGARSSSRFCVILDISFVNHNFPG